MSGVTFNVMRQATNVKRKSNNVYSSDYYNSTVFDYFVDSPALHDAIYFSYYTFNAYSGLGFWKDIQIRIGTPRTNSGAGVWEYSSGSLSFSSGSVDITNDKINYAGQPFNTGDVIEFNKGTTVPGGITDNGTYFVRKIDANNFQLHPTLTDATNNTNKIDFTSQGSGTHRITKWSDLTSRITSDATAGFTAAAGSQNLSFNPPDDWMELLIPPNTDLFRNWIRYRITDATGITEGGANSTTVVKCGDYAYNVVGYSNAIPAAFSDISAQDTADGRGLVSKTGYSVMIKCNLFIGDESTDTYFKDSAKTVQIEGQVYVSSKAYVTLGTKTASNNAVIDGLNFSQRTFTATKVMKSYSMRNNTNSIVNMYGVNFIGSYYCQLKGSSGYQFEMFGCNFSAVGLMLTGYIAIDRMSISNNGDGFRFNGTPLNLVPNDVCIYSNSASAVGVDYVNNSNIFECRGFVFKNCSASSNWGASSNVINVVLNVYDAVGFSISPVAKSAVTYTGCYVNEYYSLNYTILDKQNKPIQGATVTAANNFGTFSGITDTNGNISMDVKVKSLDVSTSTVTDNTLVTVSISANGFETIKDTQILNKKMTDICCLQHSAFSSADEMGVNWI